MKKKLIKPLCLLGAVILFFALLSRIMLSGGETLADYAEKQAATSTTATE